MRRVRLIKYAAYGALFFIGAYLSAFQRVMDGMTGRFSGSMVLSGTVVAFHFLGVFAGPLAAGELSDRFGKKSAITGAFLLSSIGLAVIVSAPAAAALMTGVFLAGAALGTLEGTLTASLADLFPEKSGRMILVSQIYLCAGTVAGPFLAAASLNAGGGWEPLYCAWIAVSLAFMLFFGFSKHPARPARDERAGLLSLRLLREPYFLSLCLCMLLYVGVEEGLAFWMTSYITRSAMPQAVTDWALPGFWIGMTTGKPLFIGMTVRYGKRVALMAVSAAGVILLTAFLKIPLLSVILFFLTGFALSGIFPFVMAMAGSRYPQYTGTAFGIIMSSCAVGGISVPFLMGVINEASGFRASLLLCAVFMLGVAAILRLSSDHKKPISV